MAPFDSSELRESMSKNGIAVQEIGSGSPVVIVRGGIHGAEQWAARQPLAARYHLILPFAPIPSSAPEDLQEEARLVAGTVPSSAHFVAHGSGAAVALQTAVMHPGRVRSLTLIDSGLSSMPMTYSSIPTLILNEGADTNARIRDFLGGVEAERNATVVRVYSEAYCRGDYATIGKLLSPGATIHGVLGDGSFEVVLPIWQELRFAFDTQIHIEELVATENHVAVRYKETGIFRNPFRGQTPTGKEYSIVAMEWFQMRDGLIEERWGIRDSTTILRQLVAA